MALNPRPSARRCPSCGSRLEVEARVCAICGTAVPWRMTPRGVVVESLLAVGLAAVIVGGLLWVRRWRAVPVSPQEAVVGELVGVTPTDMPTLTPAIAAIGTAPAADPGPPGHLAAAPGDAGVGSATLPPPGETPAAVEAPPSPSAAPGVTTHVIESGDSLYAIAIANGITLDDLLAANPGMTTDSFLAIGQSINVPADAAEVDSGAAPPTASPAPTTVLPAATGLPAVPVTHTIAAGDTLVALAAGNGATVDDLVAWNGLSGPDAVLRVGDALVVRPAATGGAVSASPIGGAAGLRPELGEPSALVGDYPAPDLLAPGVAAVVTDEAPYLRWASVGVLPEDVYYVVMARAVPDDVDAAGANPPPPVDLDDVEVIWALNNITAVRVPSRFRPAFGAEERIQWAVSIRRRADGLLADGVGKALSVYSPWRTFTWAPGGG